MHVRSQVILKGPSGLPEDRYVNTMHWDLGLSTLEAMADLILPELETFYTGLEAYLAKAISNTVEVRFYDMGDPEPRVPDIREFVLTKSGSPLASLPSEVALCLSFHGAPPHTARRRGRIFLGPFNASAALDGSASLTAMSRPLPAFRTAVANGAANLLVELSNTWVIYSPTGDELVPVVGGWVDDSWDTQRSRGEETTTRSVWPVV